MNKKNRKLDFGITTLLIVGILIVVNFLSYQIFVRLDLTQNKDFSISEASKNIARDLDDVVNIKLYFSKNLPQQFVSLPQEVGDILDEYVNYSDGKINVEFIDPSTLENAEEELYRLGIPAIQFNVLEKDKYQSVKGYLGMLVQHGTKTEVIPVLESTYNLEYQTTLAIKKVSSHEIPTLGVLTGFGTKDLDSEISTALRKLQEAYRIQRINLETNPEISASIDALLVIGPSEEFSEEQLRAIDDFLMNGGSLLLALDGITVGDGLVPAVNEANINNLIEKYGLQVNTDLILDSSAGMASFSSGFFTFSSEYYFWPKILKSGFDQENVSVAKMETAMLPWVSSINLNESKLSADSRISRLMQTSENSWAQTDNFNLDPQQRFSPINKGKRLVAVSVFGNFSSAYSEDRSADARIIVIGDSDFIADGFLRQSPDNLILFQNLVDSLAMDDDLISIRSKGITSRPIKDMSDQEKATLRYLNVFGVTVLVIIFGMTRYYLRKRSRFIDEL